MRTRYFLIIFLLNVSIAQLFSQIYSAADLAALRLIDYQCDDNNRLNWRSEPHPGLWNGVTWSSDDTARVIALDLFFLQMEGNLDVSSLKELTRLNCARNDFDGLNISYLPKLDTLYCDHNWLTSLDVSTTTNLKLLGCSENLLKSIDLSAATNLTNLDCEANLLKALDVSKSIKLTELHCGLNSIDTLDLTALAKLSYLDCTHNSLSYLGLTSLSRLWIIHCPDNNLTELDISDSDSLSVLNCSGNLLTALDLSKHARIYKLNCSNNLLTFLAMNQFNLSEIDCSLNNLPFSSLATGLNTQFYTFAPQNKLFHDDTIQGNTTIDYSAEAMINDVPTQFGFYKDGVEVLTNSTGMYTTKGSGVYYCTMTNGLFPGLTLTSASITIEGANGLADNLNNEGSFIAVYPNPVYDVLNVKGKSENSLITIFDMKGQIVFEKKYKEKDFSINTQNFKSGLYLLRTTNQSDIYSFRFLKK